MPQIVSLDRKRWRQIVVVALGFLIIDLALLDRWQVAGRVTDADTGESISGAWVLADFSGERPLINLPIPPHPSHRTTTCMGSKTVRTGVFGLFVFDELELNRPLANKSAFITVFKPGWISQSDDAVLSSGILTWPGLIHVRLERGPGERTDPRSRSAGDPSFSLPAKERMSSRELLQTLHVVAGPVCSTADLALAALAMQHAVDIAETYDERERVRSSCLAVELQVKSLKQSKRGGFDWYQLFSSDFSWGFHCDELHFAHQPQPNVLAVEDRVRQSGSQPGLSIGPDPILKRHDQE